MMMLRLPLSWLSPSGPRGRLSILIFHRVLREPDALIPELPSASAFEATMRWVRDWFNVLPLGEAVERLYAGTIPARALAITFDDGYADNEEVAAPILNRLGLPATFFIATGFIGGGCMWNDQVIEAIRRVRAMELDLRQFGLSVHALDSDAARRRAVTEVLGAIKHLDQQRRQSIADAIGALAGLERPTPLMMTVDQLRAMRRTHGMEIGAHTVTHPILTRLSGAAALDEIARGKRELEAMVGETVRLFAYPNGVPEQDYRPEHAAMVRDCGFEAAVSTAWGAASASSERFQLPRFTPWDRTRMRYGVRLLHNLQRNEKVAA
jgi:peptidoglycan/xylan/chitin deacetylase (PgdA/CDA1 family)